MADWLKETQLVAGLKKGGLAADLKADALQAFLKKGGLASDLKAKALVAKEGVPQFYLKALATMDGVVTRKAEDKAAMESLLTGFIRRYITGNAADGAAGDACSTHASGDEPRRAAGLLEAAVRLRVHILRPRGRGLRPPEIT